MAKKKDRSIHMQVKSPKIKFSETYNQLAKHIAFKCCRNTFIEDLHSGIGPITKNGDFSDVKVIDGRGREIPWNKVSRISDEEMRKLNKEVVNKIYTFFMLKDDEKAQEMFFCHNLRDWDDAQLDEDFMKALALRK